MRTLSKRKSDENYKTYDLKSFQAHPELCQSSVNNEDFELRAVKIKNI